MMIVKVAVVVLMLSLSLVTVVGKKKEKKQLEVFSGRNKTARADIPMFEQGKCRSLWRPEHLLGKCFGLKDQESFSSLKGIPKAESVQDCRSLCCNMGEECISWQFEKIQGICKLGGVMRLGLENTGTPEWCDPLPPDIWKGNKLKSRVARDGKNTCEWGERLRHQCFGLGNERKNSKGEKLDSASCAQACCDDPNCALWQEDRHRGCFFAPNPKDDIWCEVESKKYDGGRKCVKGFCGGLEDKLLNNNNKTKTN